MTESATVPAEGATKTAVDSANIPDAATGTGANQPVTAGDAALPAVKFGAWPSPIHAADVARGLTRISYPRVIGADMWWQEGRPDEDGRMTVVHRGADAKSRVLLPAPWNARTRVHEYGGLSYLPVPRASVVPPVAGGQPPRGHAIVFANYSDQRLYVAATEAADARQAVAPRPLTPTRPRWTGPASSLPDCASLTSRCPPTAARCGASRNGRPAARSPARSSPCRWTAPRPASRTRSGSWPRDRTSSPSPPRRPTAAGWPGSAGITRTCRGTAPSCGSRPSRMASRAPAGW